MTKICKTTQRGNSMEYSFHVYNTMADIGMSLALTKILENEKTPPIVVCIGSDLAIGDSLGPIVGTLLEKELKSQAYVYGTLRHPVTAKEMKYMSEFLRQTHPKSKVIAVDAAVGEESEIGLIKVSDVPLRPGSGANKRLGAIGDVSILGIIAKKSAFSYAQLNLTRLNTVYSMAVTVSKAISNYLTDQKEQRCTG